VRNEIGNKMEKNWKGNEYLPRVVLKAIFGDATIGALLDDCNSLKETSQFCTMLASQGRPFNLERFRDNLISDGHRLLATCIFCSIPLAALYCLMENEKKDSDMPLKQEDFPDEVYRIDNMGKVKVSMFIAWQGSFKAHEFLKAIPPLRHEIPIQIVVPIWFDEDNPIGRGGFGEVFEAKIHPSHHGFSTVSTVALTLHKLIFSRIETSPLLLNASSQPTRLP
jgi:hypothetical protein